MSNQFVILLFAVLIVGYASYSTFKLGNKILCRYTSISKEVSEKIVSLKARNVIFDGKKFNVIPSCIKVLRYKRGILAFFPTNILVLDYDWNDRNPIDPNTGKPKVMSPEDEQAIDEEASMRHYAHGQTQTINGGKPTRLGGLQQYLPLIAIGLVVIVAGYFYMQNKAITADMNIIKMTLQNILTKGQ